MNKSPRPSFRDVGWVRWPDFEGICSCGQISVGFSLMDWLMAFLSGGWVCPYVEGEGDWMVSVVGEGG